MRRLHLFASVFTAVAAVGCATTSDEEPLDGLNEPSVSGFDAVGSVTEIVTNNAGRAFPNIQFNVKVTLVNVGTAATEVTYRTSCPVRLELHSLDGSKVYDESMRDCEPGLSTVTLAPGAQKSLFSGVRFPTTVLGDSLNAGRYRIVAVLQRDENPLRVEAGNYNIPLCVTDLGCRPVAAARGAGK